MRSIIALVEESLKIAYRALADFTEPECKSGCKIPQSCCSSEYCGMAIERAAEEGITLHITNHLTLPLMGPHGCIAEPWMRPLCTFHVCCINGFGFKPGDPEWTQRYFQLREIVEDEENQDYLRRTDRS